MAEEKQRLYFGQSLEVNHPDDIERMEQVLGAAGFECSQADLALAWKAYSESSCASWLSLPDDEELLNILMAQLSDTPPAMVQRYR